MGTEKLSAFAVFVHQKNCEIFDEGPERARWERAVSAAWFRTASLKAKISLLRLAESNLEEIAAAFEDFAVAVSQLHRSSHIARGAYNTFRFSMACDRAWFALRRAGR